MTAILKSSMFWRFMGGFALGGFGVLAFHPATAQTAPTAPAAIVQAQ